MALLALLLSLSAPVLAGTAATDKLACSLTKADKAANAQLSFDAFDQQGATSTTGRALAERGCYLKAAEAWEDYLVRGPSRTAGQQGSLLFHLGQMLASAGDERGAARAIAGARQPTAIGEFNWNAYVEGTWAFLTKDLLEAARSRLAAASGPGNRMNASMLGALERCFEKTYAQAVKECRDKGGSSPLTK